MPRQLARCLAAVLPAFLAATIAAGQEPAPPAPGTIPTGNVTQPSVKDPSVPADGVAVPPPSNSKFNFKIPVRTPLKKLLPPAPSAAAPARPLLDDDLSRVPEIAFEAKRTKRKSGEASERQLAHQLAKIRHLDQQKADGFWRTLIEQRNDLAGLPVAMGDACHLTQERQTAFAVALGLVRGALAVAEANTLPHNPDKFWKAFQTQCDDEKGEIAKLSIHPEQFAAARVAALMQILATEPVGMRVSLAQHLASESHVEATRALAKLALFSEEEEVRQAAIDGLKVRRERDYTDLLLAGLRYPRPVVARRAADALARLERSDIIPRLVALLEEPDPRGPQTRKIDGRDVTVVRELVKLNHHRNCVLCHAPARPDPERRIDPDPDRRNGQLLANTMRAEVPIPEEPLLPPSQGYSSDEPELAIRIDVTYLRPDFSLRHRVDHAEPWPEMQRFDYLVRTRTVTPEEAQAVREALQPTQPDTPSPYHRAALAALRELTGRDAAPTAEAWRSVLKLQ